jgi:hypothetical protein
MIDPGSVMGARRTTTGRRVFPRWLVPVLALLAAPGPAGAVYFSLEGGAPAPAWSGYWWPLLVTHGWHLYDQTGPYTPLLKYGQALGNYGPLEWERRYKLTTDPSTDWWGHSNGWAAASILERAEPRQSVRVGSTTFNVGEIKGLLTAAHQGDPVDLFRGQPHWRGGNSSTDLRALDFHRAVLYYMRDRSESLIFNLSLEPDVWNYPAYHFRMNGLTDPRDPQVTHVTTELWFADQDVAPHFVGTKGVYRVFTYSVRGDPRDVTNTAGADWTGESVRNHPQFVWHPAYARPHEPAFGEPPSGLDVEWVRRLAQVSAGSGPATGSLSVDPAELSFGSVAVGRAVTRTLIVRGTGTEAVSGTVGALSVPFSVLEGGGSFSLARGAGKQITVAFAPAQISPPGGFRATLTITSALPGAQAITVPLSGESHRGGGLGLAPDPQEGLTVRMTPAEITFGRCKEGSVTIVNEGAMPVRIRVGNLEPPFEVVAGGGESLLGAGEKHTVTVRFCPPAGTQSTAFDATLRISSDDPAVGVVELPVRVRTS